MKMNTAKPTRLGNHILSLSGNINPSGNEKLAIGVDPGVNFGLTLIHMDQVTVLYGKLPSDKRPGYRGISAYNFIMRNDAIREFPLCEAIIEGAAYNDRFGQVTLEEVRFGFFFALYRLGFDVSIVPPATIRKGALGDGRATVGDLFPSMNHNAADSIGCALYVLNKELI
jgi:hypothetical protein